MFKGAWIKTIDVSLIPLAQFRKNAKDNKTNESYTITWWKGEKVLKEFTNKTRLEVDGRNAVGKYTVDVKFTTDEVKVDKKNLLSSIIRYRITKNCEY